MTKKVQIHNLKTKGTLEIYLKQIQRKIFCSKIKYKI